MSKLQEWSNAVKSRDGKCLECGSTEDLHAHHIKPKASHPELTLDVSNGKTLCYRCHKREHERNGRVRMRSNRPQRRTLQRRIDELEAEVAMLKNKSMKLSKKVGECDRGSCKSGLKLSAVQQ